MSNIIISDGRGLGASAGVNSDNRLMTDAVTTPEDSHATAAGDSYNLNTGTLTLNSSAESGLMYLQNTGAKDIHVSSIAFLMGPSTGGDTTDASRLIVYRNPTGGTVISGASNVEINSNRNFGTSKTLDANVYKGGQGFTFTGGSFHIETLAPVPTRIIFSIDTILTKTDSIGLSIVPLASNTNMKIMAAINCHTISGAI